MTRLPRQWREVQLPHRVRHRLEEAATGHRDHTLVDGRKDQAPHPVYNRLGKTAAGRKDQVSRLERRVLCSTVSGTPPPDARTTKQQAMFANDTSRPAVGAKKERRLDIVRSPGTAAMEAAQEMVMAGS